MNKPLDLLLGRKTFEIWAPHWPQHTDAWPGANAATKYVASNTMTSGEWQPSVFSTQIVQKSVENQARARARFARLGSDTLILTLFKHDLVDAFWLMICPITLGVGKRLFADGTIPRAFKETESKFTSIGVIVVNYEREAQSRPEVYEYSLKADDFLRKSQLACGVRPQKPCFISQPWSFHEASHGYWWYLFQSQRRSGATGLV